jgi:hypothetical protein
MIIAIPLRDMHVVVKLNIGSRSPDVQRFQTPHSSTRLGCGSSASRTQHGARKADATAGRGEVAKEPRVFPRRRLDLSDAEAERREALRAPPSPESVQTSEHV